jgi:hypothetical protein
MAFAMASTARWKTSWTVSELIGRRYTFATVRSSSHPVSIAASIAVEKLSYQGHWLGSFVG